MPDPVPDPVPHEDPTEESVRRLLAEARHDEPLPADVAQRLDTLLGELVTARAARPATDELSVRRQERQRRRTLVLVAAAAAVVLGIGVPAIRGAGSQDSGTASDSSSTSGSAADSSSSEAGAGAPLDQSRTSEAAPAPAQLPPGAVVLPTVALTEAGFEQQVRDADPALAAKESGAAGAYDSQLTLSFLPEQCQGADYGSGQLVAATYDGDPAVLAYRTSEAGQGGQQVDLLICGTAEVIRTTTIPAP